MGKKIYVVTGSGDGLIGAFSSKKKAIETAEIYVGERHDGWIPSDGTIYGDCASATINELILDFNPLPEKEID